MTPISPTRVSMYDFLYQDTQPLVSLLADAASLSLPQTRIALTSALQAIIGALLAYHQRHQGQVLSKKLFGRGAVKELRQYNAMNFKTLNAAAYYRNDVADSLFGDSARVAEACNHIANQLDTKSSKVQVLLNNVTIIVLRELAILADYSQLDHAELDKWFALQPQFLSSARFEADLQADTLISTDQESSLSAQQPIAENALSEQDDHPLTSNITDIAPPPFDTYWYKLNDFKPLHDPSVQDMQQATPNYLKVIGRSPENTREGRHDDRLVFGAMPTIALPHQRWLLQLAKISDIYLSRNRLRITSEPVSPPTRPLVSLSLLSINSDDTPTTISEKPIEYETKPLWKNPVILITLLVIAVLSALQALKYQIQQTNTTTATTTTAQTLDKNEERQQQDVAIVKIEELDEGSQDALGE